MNDLKPGDYIVIGFVRSRIPVLRHLINWWRARSARKEMLRRGFSPLQADGIVGEVMRVTEVTNTTLEVAE